MIGSRIGHFEITAKLGEGGMGEVYRAQDERLGREVAIKVLPEALVADPERLGRFEREARLLASLNHPHIAAVYDVGEHQGRRFLVMELVVGETLAERGARGPVPLAEALGLAIQMAGALEAAHGRGIVHRDLKPANVMIDGQGQVKVLDFGLAKALAAEGGGSPRSDLLDSPTLTYQGTVAGVVLGTAAYMSPEQARGGAVDARADVWAFGCVLYEMLCGRRAFAGSSMADTLGAVVAGEPDWSALPSSLPAPVRKVLRRCLAKDPRQRLHHVADARIELADVLAGAPGEPADQRPAARMRPPIRLALAALVGALLGALAVWGWLAGTGAGADAPARRPSRWTVDASAQGQLDLGGRLDPLALSPDGRTLAYVVRDTRGETHLYLRDFAALDARPVPGSEGASNPFFSPDGRWLAFFASDRLKKAPVGGGAPVDLADAPLDNLGATWGEHGTIVFASYSSGLWQVADSGGEPELLTPGGAEGAVQHRWPTFLPGGERVLFILQTLEGPRPAIFDLARREHQAVPGVQQVVKARYLRGGYLVFAQEGSLLAAPFDALRGRLLDTPVPVLSGFSMHSDHGAANFETSAAGTLAYVGGEATSDAALFWVDRQGGEEIAVDHRAFFSHPRLSPDGSRLAVEIGSEIGARHVEIFDLGRGTRAILTAEARNAQPAWHPDGQRVAVVSDRAGNWDLYLAALGGQRTVTPLLVRPLEQWLGTFTPDGEALVFYEVDPRTARDIWVLDLNTGGTRPYRATAANERGVRLSPDGRWLAYVSNESGRDEVYVERFPEPGPKWTVSGSGGVEPVWSP
ncbi:MAG TPA: protein kinase, partial [Thermoanaerobaculia bacterium]|nr:protein kinase [Thermoanaerobaculia bacterium]